MLCLLESPTTFSITLVSWFEAPSGQGNQVRGDEGQGILRECSLVIQVGDKVPKHNRIAHMHTHAHTHTHTHTQKHMYVPTPTQIRTQGRSTLLMNALKSE